MPTDEPTPVGGVNPPPPPPRPISVVLRIVSLVLGFVGIALLPTGPASLGLALIAVGLALLAAVANGDEPINPGKVNPPPPRGKMIRLLVLHILSILVGAVGLYLIARQLDGGWGIRLIGAGLVLNLADFFLNVSRYRSPGATR